MPHYSDGELLQNLRECKKKHGEVNTSILNSDDDFPSGPTYGYRFDSFVSALKEAGLDDEASKARRRTKKNTYSKEETIEYLEEISDNGIITRKIIESSNGPTIKTILKNLSIDSIEELSDVTDNISVISERERSVESEEYVRDGLLEASNDNGKVTKKLLDENDNYPSVSDVEYYYGSVSNASEELGINVHRETPLSTATRVFNSTYIYTIYEDDKLKIRHTSNISRTIRSLSKDNIKIERMVEVKENVLDEIKNLLVQIEESDYEINVSYEGRTVIECDNCGEKFSKQSHKVNESNNFCSRYCKDESGREVKECVVCGSTERVQKSSYSYTNGWVCSPECNYQKYRDVVECMMCGRKEKKLKSKIDEYKPHFCSVDCSKEYNTVETVCDNCGDKLTISRLRSEQYENQYCDLDCLHEAQNGEYNSNNLDAKLQSWAKKVKRRQSYTCEECGKSYDVMCAHHIPPKSELDTEDMLDTDNGICLCYPCHADKHDGHMRKLIMSWWEWYDDQ